MAISSKSFYELRDDLCLFFDGLGQDEDWKHKIEESKCIMQASQHPLWEVNASS